MIDQFNHSYKNFGWTAKSADPDDLNAFEEAISPRTKAIFIESIANPGGVVCDIAAISRIARRARVPLIVDNTMASPYLIRPFGRGAHRGHSATKFLGGHGNSLGGVIVDGGSFDWMVDQRYPDALGAGPEYGGVVLGGRSQFRLRDHLPGAGAARSRAGPVAAQRLSAADGDRDAAPADAAPMRQRPRNRDLALRPRPREMVGYAGLPATATTNLARRYCPKGAGAVFTFGLKGGYQAGIALIETLKLFSHLANVGDVRSLVIHPASDDAPAVVGPARRSPQAPAPTWCGCRSGWRIRPI